MTAGTDAAGALFAESFAGRPAGFWQAPGRVNLIGEHTDYNDGFVLPFAIDRATTVAVGLREDGRVRLVSTFDDGVVESDLDAVAARKFDGWAAYPLGVAWAMQERGVQLPPGFEIAIHSEVPVGAGLSSSAAIEMAVAAALNDLCDAGLDRTDLARIGQRAENIAVGAPTGIMDQSASVFGQPDAAVFLDCRTLAVEQVPLGLDAAGLVVLVVDSKVEHQHATGGYRDRRAACERGAEVLGVAALRDLSESDLPRARAELDDVTFRRVRHVVTEDARVLASVDALGDGDLQRFGRLMSESHVSMRDDFEISVPQLDLIVEIAEQQGALGARMTGGGFGGSAVALIDGALVDATSAAILAGFADRGWTAPLPFAVVPSAGAGRVPGL